MQLEFHQVDAFASQPFTGNPAMVYRLDRWLDDALMQQIAGEHNLAETAFVVKEGAAWHIRWFTPTAEVPLCGHATLASAHVLFEVYGEPGDVLDFTCLSGALRVSRAGSMLVLDFPVRRAQPCDLHADVERVLGLPVDSVLALHEGQGIQELLAVLPSEAAVRAYKPDLAAVATLPAEEQVAAAVAGKDELKQAAKRVREAKRKTREETPVKAADEAVGPTDAPAADELQTLRARVAELTAENEALRQQLAQLRGSDAPSTGDDGQPF